MQDFESFLSSGAPGEVSADRLKSFGQRAASRLVNCQTPMNDTIASLVKEAGLNPEQVKRVVEEANNSAFRSFFKEGFTQNIEFPVADYEGVMSRCGVEKTASAPILLTNTARPRYIPGAEGATEADIFGLDAERVAQIEKTAAPVTREKGVADLAHELQNHKADLQSTLIAFSDGLNGVVHMVKRASAEGFSPAMIGAAIEGADPSYGLKLVLKDELGDRVEFGTLSKFAQLGMELSPQSPFTGLVQDLESVSQKLVVSQQAVNQTQMAMDSLLQVLRGPPVGMGSNQIFQPAPEAAEPVAPPVPPVPGAAVPAPPPPDVGPLATAPTGNAAANLMSGNPAEGPQMAPPMGVGNA